MMKWLILFLIATVLTGCFIFRKVLLRTYTISGDITLLNDCTGIGADNPSTLDIEIRLWLQGDTSPRLYRQSIPMVTVGVTSIGNYTASSVLTNIKAVKWEVTFPKACAMILCPPGGGDCVEMGTNPRTIILNPAINVTLNHDYHCGCN